MFSLAFRQKKTQLFAMDKNQVTSNSVNFVTQYTIIFDTSRYVDSSSGLKHWPLKDSMVQEKNSLIIWKRWTWDFVFKIVFK